MTYLNRLLLIVPLLAIVVSGAEAQDQFTISGTIPAEYDGADTSPRPDIGYINVPYIQEKEEYKALTKPIWDSMAAASKLKFMVEKRIIKGFNTDSLEEVIRALQGELLNRKIQFVKTYSAAYIGLYTFNSEIINYCNLTPDSLMQLYSTFDASLKATDLGKSVHALLQKKKSLLVNNILPDFSFSTDKGESYSLSSFRDQKYVLLCFWDYGCGPCIRSIPVMRKIDNTYNTKGLQLIHVSIDNDETKWRESLKRVNMTWLQTCDLPAWIKDARVRSLYDIQYIPQYFLIDKDGRLIYHNGQMKDNDDYTLLQEKLARLLH